MALPWYRRIFGAGSNSNQVEAENRAEQGDADAQFGIGLLYANREGQGQDYAQAAHWYAKAADQSHPLAQFNLGLMYSKGQGVGRDEAVAQSWFGRAARLGDAGAQFNLGVHCHRASFGEETQGEPESKVEAYKWFCLSSAQGYKGAIGACERLALTMTREEVADGEERAATFLRGSVV